MQHEERDLIARDPEIIGLAVLLDESKVLNLMRSQMPNAGIHRVEKIYLRYKPGTNCLVKYRVLSDGGSSQWYLKAYSVSDADKLKRVTISSDSEPLAPLVSREHLLALYPFPLDGKLKLLPRLFEPNALQQLLNRILYPNTLTNRQVRSIELLQYKPERRLVAKLIMMSGEAVVLKVYTLQRFQLANLARRRKLNSSPLLDVVGRSNKHRLLVHRWIEGDNLTQCYHNDHLDPAAFFQSGHYLAGFHRHSKTKQVIEKDTQEFITTLERCAIGVTQLVPEIKNQLTPLLTQLISALQTLESSKTVIHGDCYAKQVLMTPSGVRLIDFDDVCYWFSAYDLGVFIAHLERDELLGKLSTTEAQSYRKALLLGYQQQHQCRDSDVELFTAIGLLQLTHHPFRNAQQHWATSIHQLIKRCQQHLASHQLLANVADFGGKFSAAYQLVDRPSAQQLMRDSLEQVSAPDQLINIEIIRHKPNKRALIEYTFQRADGKQQVILGKVKMKRFDNHTWNLNSALHQAQFGHSNIDGVMVPAPLGHSKNHHVWFQEKVAGQVCFDGFCHNEDCRVAERIAQALYKLHSSNIKTERHHTHHNEIALLEGYLNQAIDKLPSYSSDILDILSHCKQRANQLPTPVSPVTIHRDFYHDQILIDNERVYLLDLDLVCYGDPALDIGNFIAHVEEQCLRQFDQLDYAQPQIERFIQHYQALAGCDLRARIETYTLLSWARHVFISQRIAQRNPWTVRIIQECKKRVG